MTRKIKIYGEGSDQELDSTGERYLPGWAGQSELEHLHRYLLAAQFADGKTVLDIASGEGYGSEILANFAKRVIGVDISEEAVAHASKSYNLPNLEFKVGDCAEIPLADASVDLVTSFETIEHCTMHEEMMAEVKRVLKPGGLLVISTPDKKNFNEAVGENTEFHVKELYENEFKDLINASFEHTRFIAQRVLRGSFIFDNTRAAKVESHLIDGPEVQTASGLRKPIFWVAIASDAELPEVDLGVLENAHDELAHLKTVIADRDSYIKHLESAQAEFEERAQDLRRELTDTIEEKNKSVQALHAATDALNHRHANEIEKNEQAIAHLQSILDERNRTIEILKDLSAERESVSAQGEALVKGQQEARATLDEIREDIRSAQKQAMGAILKMSADKEHIGALEAALDTQNKIINDLANSSSWKLTAPLRKIAAAVKGVPAGEPRPVSPHTGAAPGAEAFFTICSKNFLAHARALYHSIAPFYPNARFFVALCDRVDGMFDPAVEPFEFVYPDELDIPKFDGMARRYNITELNTAIKPFVFLKLMEKYGFGSVVYLDPDLYFVSKMDELDNMLRDGAEAVLTPHILTPAEGAEVHDQKMLVFGVFNLGFLALRATPAVKQFLAWWARRLEHDCVIKLEEGLFVDQKWADLLPAFVPGTRILHHPGYNVAYWNLPQRTITQRDGAWQSNGAALRFVHFSGNRIDEHNVFSRHSQQVTIESIGDLKHLLDEYREQVHANGHAFYRSLPYAFSWEGESGKNEHTPKALDQAQGDVANGGAGGTAPAASAHGAAATSVEATPHAEGVFDSGQQRDGFLSSALRALSVSMALSGGALPMAKRAYRSYRTHGWEHVKSKAVKLGKFKTPAAQTLADAQSTKVVPAASTPQLLYLDWGIPKPDRDAASVTAIELFKIFQSQGYAITFMPLSLEYEEGYYEALTALGIDVPVYPAVTSAVEWIQESAARFDICVLARGPVGWHYLKQLKSVAPDLKLIFNTVDLHYLRESRKAELTNDKKLAETALEYFRQEIEMIDTCDVTILLSQEEQYHILEVRPEANLKILPVVFDDIPGSKNDHADRRDIMFVGSFIHDPNVDAVLYFANEVLPLVREQLPDVTFKIVGSNAPKSVQQLGEREGVEILGFVPDLDGLLDSIRLSVAPLRYGAGIKGKIASSMIRGVPCIATPEAVEGMGLTNGLNALIGATPEEFAAKVCDAYKDEVLWETVSRGGHQFALDHYSTDVIGRQVKQLIFSLNNGWQQMHSAFAIDDWDGYLRHQKRMGLEYKRRHEVEKALLPADGESTFYTDGFCAICGKPTTFTTSYMYASGNYPDGGPARPNWREHLQCGHCGLVNRVRAALHALHTMTDVSPEKRIYITERVTDTYDWLSQRYPNLQGSEYFGPDKKPGSNQGGVRHEDVQSLSFEDRAFDIVLSFDVLEHVPDPDKAFSELYRVLDSGGQFLLGVPFGANQKDDIIRATLRSDGTLEHHLPEEYHGNPVDPEGGALCFRYFGWDMLERLRKIGFRKASCIAYWSRQQGYLGTEQYLFIAYK